jgi:hypothetical protein
MTMACPAAAIADASACSRAPEPTTSTRRVRSSRGVVEGAEGVLTERRVTRRAEFRYPRRVADEAKTPVAIRIMRPYADEHEFLARELDTLTRTSIVLLGAPQRPQGVVLRFEVALASGAPLVRGEGRVVAFKERVFEDLAGLTLRFTRLDSRSKALVDRAAAMRDARSRPPPPPRAASAPPAPPPTKNASPPLELDLEATRAEAPHAKLRSDRPPPAPPTPQRSSPPRRATPPPLPSKAARVAPPAPVVPLDLETTHAEVPNTKRGSSAPPPPPPVAAPSDRDALLQRLRVRRSSLDEETVKALLAKKPAT